MTGSAQTGPIGRREAPVNPASETRKMNFSQIGTRPSVDRLGLNVCAGERVADGADAIGHPRQRAKHFAKDDAPVRAGLFDDARAPRAPSRCR